MPWTVMDRYETYEAARASFSWDLPSTYNPASDLLAKHDPDQPAIVWGSDTDRSPLTFGALDRRSDAVAGALVDEGLEHGDRLAVMGTQRPETLLAHCAAWKLGAITVPLTPLFGPDALGHRLTDSGARALVYSADERTAVDAVRPDCPDLDILVEIGGSDPNDALGFDTLVATGPDEFATREAAPDTLSAIMYTSGSTGPPKGVLHRHALWLGRAAAASCFFGGELDTEAVCWTPADWAWGGALGGLVFAAWHHGATVVAGPNGPFDPRQAFDTLELAAVTHAFIPPTALRMLMDVEEPTRRFDLVLSVIAAAGEPLTPEIRRWADDTLPAVSLNEFYGQTELNLVVASCDHWFDPRPGSMGWALPGYDVAVLDEEGGRCPPGDIGEIAVRPHDDRVVFAEYWDRPDATAAKRRGEWYLTGDLATRDETGFLWFHSRADDLIVTSGYRVGPAEVERAILRHPEVEQVGVVGVPDETRGQIVKAFVQPVGQPEPEPLREDIQQLVRERLAAYEYPRKIEFVSDLPTTTTGKIRRADLRPSTDRDPDV